MRQQQQKLIVLCGITPFMVVILSLIGLANDPTFATLSLSIAATLISVGASASIYAYLDRHFVATIKTYTRQLAKTREIYDSDRLPAPPSNLTQLGSALEHLICDRELSLRTRLRNALGEQEELARQRLVVTNAHKDAVAQIKDITQSARKSEIRSRKLGRAILSASNRAINFSNLIVANPKRANEFSNKLARSLVPISVLAQELADKPNRQVVSSTQPNNNISTNT